jgi:hypothetical protein
MAVARVALAVEKSQGSKKSHTDTRIAEKILVQINRKCLYCTKYNYYILTFVDSVRGGRYRIQCRYKSSGSRKS